MYSAIFVVYEAGNFNLLFGLAKRMKRDTPIDVFFYSPYYLPDTEKYKSACAAEDIPYIHATSALGGEIDITAEFLRDQDHTSAQNIKCKLPFWRRCALRLLAKLTKDDMRTGVWAQARFWTKLMQRINAIFLILPEENILRDSAAMVYGIHQNNGTAYVVTYASTVPGYGNIEYFTRQKELLVNSLNKWLLALLFPRWSRVSASGKRVFCLKPSKILEYEASGLAPRDPWMVNTGLLDYVIAESELQKAHFISHGIDERKIKALGQPILDTLHKVSSQRAQRCNTSFACVDTEKPWLVVALPARPERVNKTDYQEAIEFFFGNSCR